MSDMVVHFPWLHPKLGHGPLPEGVVFFDLSVFRFGSLCAGK